MFFILRPLCALLLLMRFFRSTFFSICLTASLSLAALRGYSATYKAYSDTNTHRVDIVLTFKQGVTLVDVNAN